MATKGWVRQAAAPLLLVGLVGLAGCGETPESVYHTVGAAAERGDWGTVYDRMDHTSQARLDAAVKMLAAFSKDRDAAKSASGRELLIKFAADHPTIRPDYRSAKVLKTEIDGDRATLTVSRVKDGKTVTETARMVREDGRWKIASAKP
jgi:Domain of unknown function (DUF4878)